MGTSLTSLGNTDEAAGCYNRAYVIAERNGDKKEMMGCIGLNSMLHSYRGELEKAYEGYIKILDFCRDQQNIGLEVATLNNIGNIHALMGLYPQALEYYFRSLTLKEEMGDMTGVINTLVNIATVLKDHGQPEKAETYAKQALIKSENQNDKRFIAQCYETIGEIYLKEKQKDAISYLQKALVIAEQTSYGVLHLNTLRKIGDYYSLQKDFSLAMHHYDQALERAESSRQFRHLTEIWLSMGKVYYEQKNYGKALDYTMKSLELAKKNKLLNKENNIHQQLFSIYEAMGSYRQALTHHKFYKEISDSIFSRKSLLEVAELEYSYKLKKERQEMELAQLKQNELVKADMRYNQKILLLAIGALTLMVVLSFVLFKLYREKRRTSDVLKTQKQKLEENEIRLQELNVSKDKFFSIIAHDLRGAFNSILGFSDLLVSYSHEKDVKIMTELAANIHSSSQNAYLLLGNLLQWSMSNIGLLSLNPKRLNFKEMIGHRED